MSPSGPAGPPPGGNRKTPRMESFSPVAHRNSEGGGVMTKSGRIPGFRAGDTPRGGDVPGVFPFKFGEIWPFPGIPRDQFIFFGHHRSGPGAKVGGGTATFTPGARFARKALSGKCRPEGTANRAPVETFFALWPSEQSLIGVRFGLPGTPKTPTFRQAVPSGRHFPDIPFCAKRALMWCGSDEFFTFAQLAVLSR